ncbi:methyltransferase family protein [Thalassobius sp. S69A]|uniref:methyltransferase family protein n=1 Tax=unclassified Thalassovita TaxID=2619711 RepID=UPI000C652355|nr:S-isoprenylcysteine methyltransferase [Paracoccaceae bacterium]
MVKWLDIPQVWVLAAAIAAWAQARFFPMGLSFGGAWADFLAGILVGGGVLLMVLALVEMRKHRTTAIPHRDADAMVTSGIFSRSRNPIYLGDVLLLAGLVLWFDAVLALPLVPLLLWLLEKRFVLPEENRLRLKFRANYARYCQKTRRWI